MILQRDARSRISGPSGIIRANRRTELEKCPRSFPNTIVTHIPGVANLFLVQVPNFSFLGFENRSRAQIKLCMNKNKITYLLYYFY
jgi:hypothetical protein